MKTEPKRKLMIWRKGKKNVFVFKMSANNRADASRLKFNKKMFYTVLLSSHIKAQVLIFREI